MKPAVRPLLLVAAMLAIAACTTILGNDFEILETAADGGGGTGATGGSGGSGGMGNYGGSTGEGPQLIGSSPENGEQNASVVPFGRLIFDRPVTVGDATGKIRVGTEAAPDGEIAQVEACLDNSPSCLRFVVPVAHTVDGRLPGGTTFTVVVDQSFPDPQGHTNDADASISYTTFAYNPDFFSDMAINDELGGIVYVGDVGGQTINALYVTGEGWINNSGPDVVRIDLSSQGQPLGVQIAATPNLYVGSCANNAVQEAYGLDHHGYRLFLSANFCNAVVPMTIDVNNGNLDPTGGFHSTDLGAPDNLLYRVDSVVVVPDGNSFLYYFGSGAHGSGPVMSGVPWYRPLYMVAWELFVERDGLFDAEPPFYLASGHEGTDTVIYLANGETILKLAQADGNELNRHVTAGASYHTPGFRTDSQGRLYVGDKTSLVVYDTTGFNGFTELAVREGLDFRRLDVREDGSVVHVYFADFQGPLEIRELVLEF